MHHISKGFTNSSVRVITSASANIFKLLQYRVLFSKYILLPCFAPPCFTALRLTPPWSTYTGAV